MTMIRKLVPEDDLSDLVELSREFFDEYSAYHKEFFQIDVLGAEDIVGYFSRTVNTENGATFIAIEDGRMIGYITVFWHQQPGYWKIKRVGTISGLMVRGNYRRQGIGKRLLSDAWNWFREKGIEYYTVYTASENRMALQFYEQAGMAPLHTTMIGKL
jgi:GNAT superfamily N-acetyltransferase